MTAVINERAHTSIVAADVVFTFITGAVGLLLGAVGWVILHRQGWVVIVVPQKAAQPAGRINVRESFAFG